MIQEDLWADPKEEFGSTGIQSKLTKQYATQPHRGLDVIETQITVQVPDVTLHLNLSRNVIDSSSSSKDALEITSIEVEDDLWAVPNNAQNLGYELENAYVANKTYSVLEGINNSQSSAAYAPRSDNKYVAGISLASEASLLGNDEETSELDFPLDSLELLDIEAELLALEQAEEQYQQQRDTKHEHKRGQAPGWMGSCSVLYINWNDEEKAQQEALERLGYTKLAISETTRSFVIQAARASSLTCRQERQYITRLINARAYLAGLPDDPSFDEQRASAKAEITEIERFLVYKMQWVGVKKAPRFLGQGVEIDDLIQHAMLGVIKGVQAFDPTRNARLLVSVNWWVFSLLNRAIANYSRLIVLPAHLHDQLMHIKRQRILLDRELGRFPTNKELAGTMHISTQKLEGFLQADEKVYSLNHYAQREDVHDGYSFQATGDAFLISEHDMFQDEIEQGSIKQEVEALLNDLSPREKLVLSLRYDLDNDIGSIRTLEEVGQELKVTRERVRQIEDKAFRKILSKFGLSKVRHRKEHV